MKPDAKSLDRVGDGVYDGLKLVAAWLKGGWYKRTPEGWEHVNPAMSAADASLVQACESAVRRER